MLNLVNCDENKVLICSTCTYLWETVYNEIDILLKVRRTCILCGIFIFYLYVSFFSHGAWFYNNVQCMLKWKLIWDFFSILINTYIRSSPDLLLCTYKSYMNLHDISHLKGERTKQWSMKIHGHVCLCCGNSFFLSVML